MNNTIYVMGVDPGLTTGVTILGVPYLSMYGNSPYRRNYFETFEVSGGYTSQALEICDASREFFPLALVVQSFFPARSATAKTKAEEYLSPVLVSTRVEFCVETKYILTNLFWQTQSQAMDVRLKAFDLYKPGPDHVQNSTRHCVTFLRRCREDTNLRDAAWGALVSRAQTRTRPAKRRLKRSARTV